MAQLLYWPCGPSAKREHSGTGATKPAKVAFEIVARRRRHDARNPAACRGAERSVEFDSRYSSYMRQLPGLGEAHAGKRGQR